MVHVLSHAFGILALAALLVVTGLVCQQFIRPLRSWRVDVILVRLTLGSLAWALLMFALAAGHWLQPSVVWSAALVLGTAGLVAAVQRSRPRPAWVPCWRTIALWAVPGILVLALFLISLTPAVGWDDSAYHLTVPKLWLEHRGFRRIPFNVYSNWPLTIELLYGLAMVLQDYVLAKLVHLLFLGCTLLATYRFVLRLTASSVASTVAVCLVLSNPVVQFEAVQANIDIAVGFFLLFGFVALERSDEEPSGETLLVAGICSGLSAASKLSGLFVLPALVSVLWARRGLRATWREAILARLRGTLVLTALTVALAMPWYTKSFLYTGDPWYPVLYPLFGGPDWSPDVHAAFTAWNERVGMGRSPLDYVLLPARVVLRSDWGYENFQGPVSRTWAVWLPLALLACGRSPTTARALVASGVYFVLWALTRQEARFLIHVLPLLAVAGALALWELVLRPMRLREGRSARASLALATVILLLVQGLMVWSARGTARRAIDAWRWVVVEGKTSPYEAMNETERFIASELPAEARLLLLNTNQGFFIHRDYVSDSFFEASQMNDLLWREPSLYGIRRTFRGLGVTHLLWFTHNWGITYPSALGALLDDPRRARLLHHSRDGRLRLYELR